MQNEEFNLYLYIFVLLSWKQFRHIETIIIIIKWIQYSSWRIFFQSHFLILFAVIHFGTFRIFGIVFFCMWMARVSFTMVMTTTNVRFFYPRFWIVMMMIMTFFSGFLFFFLWYLADDLIWSKHFFVLFWLVELCKMTIEWNTKKKKECFFFFVSEEQFFSFG